MCTWTVTGTAGTCQCMSDFQTVNRSFISYRSLKLLFSQCYVYCMVDLQTCMSAIISTWRIIFILFEQDWADSGSKQGEFDSWCQQCTVVDSEQNVPDACSYSFIFTFNMLLLRTPFNDFDKLAFRMPLNRNIACNYLLYYTCVGLLFLII